MWESVREVQASLSRALLVDVLDERSRSSLQLSLENKALSSALEEYEAALGGLLQGHPNAVGYVFAVNGMINSGDEFGSAGLFRKLWLRQLKAVATEAVAEEDAPMRDRVTLAEVAAFIDGVRAAESVGKIHARPHEPGDARDGEGEKSAAGTAPGCIAASSPNRVLPLNDRLLQVGAIVLLVLRYGAVLPDLSASNHMKPMDPSRRLNANC